MKKIRSNIFSRRATTPSPSTTWATRFRPSGQFSLPLPTASRWGLHQVVFYLRCQRHQQCQLKWPQDNDTDFKLFVGGGPHHSTAEKIYISRLEFGLFRAWQRHWKHGLFIAQRLGQHTTQLTFWSGFSAAADIQHRGFHSDLFVICAA